MLDWAAQPQSKSVIAFFIDLVREARISSNQSEGKVITGHSPGLEVQAAARASTVLRTRPLVALGTLSNCNQ